MYKKFFEFKERPFKLVPNPAYLFLSQSHEEALAHLSYAIAQGDGFVEITGEVGTGKTTLCRVFLENLGEDTEAAYIFNPKLDPIELLKEINDEFEISSDGDNIKDLTDTLNSFLMERNVAGKKVILLIDEAQNLSKGVLEQLRLLSNLETTTSKLLQIILVGQPELGEMLDTYELRQLGQRITLSCHLMPMTYKETIAYIQHRIRIASLKPCAKFTHLALWSIYKYAKGIPRLINIACDRALLTAFVMNKKKVTGSVAKKAIRELAGRGDVKRYARQRRTQALLMTAVICMILVMIVILYPFKTSNINAVFNSHESKKTNIVGANEIALSIQKNDELKTIESPKENLELLEKEVSEHDVMDETQAEQKQPIDSESELAETKTVSEAKTIHDFAGYLKNMSTHSSRRMALKIAMSLWNIESKDSQYLENIDNDFAFFKLSARQKGFLVERITNDFGLVKSLNLPAILKFYHPGGLVSEYLTLVKIANDTMVLKVSEAEEAIIVESDDVESCWSGLAYIVWKNHLSITGDIPFNVKSDSITALKMLMHDIGFAEIEINPFYDDVTEKMVKKIQQQYGLTIDGIVGPLTKIALYNEMKSLKLPYLKENAIEFDTKSP